MMIMSFGVGRLSIAVMAILMLASHVQFTTVNALPTTDTTAATTTATTTTTTTKTTTGAVKLGSTGKSASIGYDPKTNTFYGYKIGAENAFGYQGLVFIGDKSLQTGSKSIYAVKSAKKYLLRCASLNELEVNAIDTDAQDRTTQFLKQCADKYYTRKDYTAQKIAGCPVVRTRNTDPKCYGSQVIAGTFGIDAAADYLKSKPEQFETIITQIKEGLEVMASLHWYYHINKQNVAVYKEGNTYKVQFTHAESAMPLSVLHKTYKSTDYDSWRNKQDLVTTEMYREIYKKLFPNMTDKDINLKVEHAMNLRVPTKPSIVKARLQ
ncbi:hypothetical protein BDF22DRAFT_776245 [Syncephalis plumigaleata]|nr:hypothetical protein BDF22DRAFT_776245 [Syncephalis plumigaleata]